MKTTVYCVFARDWQNMPYPHEKSFETCKHRFIDLAEKSKMVFTLKEFEMRLNYDGLNIDELFILID